MLDQRRLGLKILTRADAHWRRGIAANVTAKAEKSQERFYDALRDLFVGAAVEGQTTFIVDSYIVLRLPDG
ncbi:hypothetical protein JXD38_08400 [candidate division WOR-3 bacterium]|nr:hypothetical protein [candidate division WOR-3 bacterium]